MDARKPPAKPSSRPYVNPYRRNDPTESTFSQSLKRKEQVTPPQGSYVATSYSPEKGVPTNITLGTQVSRQTFPRMTQPAAAQHPTSTRSTKTYTEAVILRVPTDPPPSVAYNRTSYSQASPDEIHNDDSSEDNNVSASSIMPIPPIGLLMSPYSIWLKELFPGNTI